MNIAEQKEEFATLINNAATLLSLIDDMEPSMTEDQERTLFETKKSITRRCWELHSDNPELDEPIYFPS